MTNENPSLDRLDASIGRLADVLDKLSATFDRQLNLVEEAFRDHAEAEHPEQPIPHHDPSLHDTL